MKNAQMLKRNWFASLCAYFAGLIFSLTVSGGCALNPPVGEPSQGDDGAVEGDGPIGTSSGVPRNIRLMDLSAAQASVLCDWTNLKQGGYGRITTCPSGSVQSTNQSNLACVNNTSALGGRCVGVTVGNIEDCANATGTDLCKFESAPECVAVATCS
jgi:hypothetical protein